MSKLLDLEPFQSQHQASNSTLVAPDRNVLLIEDNVPLRRTLKRLISKHFQTVRETDNLHDSLLAMNDLDQGDVILSDLELTPNGPGEGLEIAEITRELRKQKALTFILLSGGIDNPHTMTRIMNALATGQIDAFLSKPYDFYELTSAIRNCLRPIVPVSDK